MAGVDTGAWMDDYEKGTATDHLKLNYQHKPEKEPQE